jgi:hypothetical protein
METYEGDPQDFTPATAARATSAWRSAFSARPRATTWRARPRRDALKEVDMIQIMVPGDRDNVVVRPAARATSAALPSSTRIGSATRRPSS